MVGIRTQGRRMVGADKTTELWRILIVLVPCPDVLFSKYNTIGREMSKGRGLNLNSLKLKVICPTNCNTTTASPSLVVLGGNSLSEGRWYKSHQWMDIISQLFVDKNCNVCLEKTQIN